jgi:predicted nucleotidyltransferase
MSVQTKHPPTLNDLRAYREEIFELAARYGVSNVRVFGSVARGDAGPQSDVDLLVTAKDGTTIFDLVGLWLDLKDLLGCEVSLLSEGGLGERFKRNIEKDLISL